MLDFLMIALWFATAAMAIWGVCIVRLVMYPTLRRHGIDPDLRGWRYAASRAWVSRYKEICIENRLPLRYWRLYKALVPCSGFLVTVWLIMFVVQFWRDMIASTG